MAVKEIRLDDGDILEKNLLGMGVQWDPSDIFDYTPEQWQLFVQRIAFMRPPWIRCMSSARAYCRGVHADVHTYDWDSRMMKRLYRLLDVCQEQDIKVILGEWWSPGASFIGPDSDPVEMNDPRWARMIVDLLYELVEERGYRCIRAYNCVNEPNSRFEDPFDGVWGAAIHNLRAEMDGRGFAGLPIVGPDVYANWDRWLNYCGAHVDAAIGEYEVHWYATRDVIRQAQVARRMGHLREKVRKIAPDKRFFFGEMGCLTGRNLPGDQQMELPRYGYGVDMADMLAQALDAGMAGAMAWSFEDSMHLQRPNGTPDFLPCGDAYKDYSVKVWGFWNAVGKAFIDPQGGHGQEPETTGYWLGTKPWEDMVELRPWYFIWAPICRVFREGASSIKAHVPEEMGLRCAAALMTCERSPEHRELSFYVVNSTEYAQSTRVVLPGARGNCDLAVYEYLGAERLKRDAQGFPAVSRVERDVDLARGIHIDLPAMSVVLFTTLEGGTPIAL